MPVILDLLDIILDAIYWIWRLGPKAFFVFVFVGLILLLPLLMMGEKALGELLPLIIGLVVLIVAILLITWILAKLDLDIWNRYELWK
jgi:hypothetical protein